MSSTPDSDLRCPCGSGASYDECCGPLHAGKPAPTAEKLMRSRYCAFVLQLPEYLRRTWHETTRPVGPVLNTEVKWLRLIIDDTEQGGPFDDAGYVTFTAIGRDATGRFEQRERSRFVREPGKKESRRWFYIDGISSTR
ncbi:MAG: YchJ family protein [Canibacter sp.]